MDLLKIISAPGINFGAKKIIPRKGTISSRYHPNRSASKNKKKHRTGANCRGTTLLRTHDPLNACNVGIRRGLLQVQPAVREGTSSCFINRLAPPAGSLNESARLLFSVITFIALQFQLELWRNKSNLSTGVEELEENNDAKCHSEFVW